MMEDRRSPGETLAEALKEMVIAGVKAGLKPHDVVSAAASTLTFALALLPEDVAGEMLEAVVEDLPGMVEAQRRALDAWAAEMERRRR